MSDVDFLKSIWNDAWEGQKARQRASTGQEEALWRSGGRASKAFPNKEDSTWWDVKGMDMFQSWVDWRNGTNGWKIWVTDDGTPAIELALEPKVDDTIPIQMHIDRVMVTPDGELVILDLKTGQRTPQSDLQLAFYAYGLGKILGVRPSLGTYWMARTGATSPIVSLDEYDDDMIEHLVRQFDKARKQELFIPNHGHCFICDMTKVCKWYKKEII